MKTKHFSVISIIILSVMFLNAKAQSSPDKESARVFVQKFYDWYAVMDADDGFIKNHNASPFNFAVMHRGGAFDNTLYTALIHYFKAPLKDDEIGLDFDPISAAQDTRSGFQTGEVKQVGNKFFVDIHDIKSGKTRKEILAAELALTAEVVQVDGNWKFVNFIYPKTDGGGNLLAYLKDIRDHSEKKIK